ncbi:MAG: hypothetical protein L3I99_01975 [Sulfurimonas sp.]|nr:hypothetical protein [Sulfurimonas sp.]
MKALLDYLEKAEGTKVHYNKTEDDITTPYGIYAKVHPNAKLVLYIQKISKKIGIDSKSKKWSHKDLQKINEYLIGKEKKVRALASAFYEEFLKNAHLDKFPQECQVAMFSIFTNSNTRAWRAVQQSIINIEESKMLKFGRLSTVDGIYGRKTKNALIVINKEFSKEGYMYFKTLMLSNMKTEYIKLATSSPRKFLIYLRGWDNRMNNLANK